MSTIGLDSGACLTLLRQALSDLDATSTGRWSDSTLVNWIDTANKRMIGDILFPDCKITLPTVPGQQVYQWPLMLEVTAIYLSGELIVPSDLPTLEGRQIGYWDATSGGNTGVIPASGGDQPAGSTGQSAPAWTVTEPASYPDSTGTWSSGFPAPDAAPWTPYQRPRYYWRGGFLGLPRIPSDVAIIQVDGVRQPNTIPYVTSGGSTVPQPMTSPENFKPGIVWAAACWAFFSNGDDNARKQLEICERNYQAEKRKMLAWRGVRQGPIVEGPKVRTLRPQFSRQRVRRYGGSR